ncbi:septum formation inhibitor Maf [Peribacillus asahii]|uniref:dTTP/UTP pyrophosphatase n=1 Tax=Peribacillus asahii TaxID=228899 RepID=A0A398BLC8_9BACI|nr:Maf family protein [Peribacillus asahii]RID88173.1 septum formation inhibitor Maf [Peribacillus asahii]
MESLILASSSPRRKELLQLLQIPFQSMNANVNEDFPEQMKADEVVKELAFRKASAIARTHPDHWVIGSDTIVVLNDTILGKPLDRNDAKRTLTELSGQTHEVYTGVAILFQKNSTVFLEKTKVTFWELSEEDIEQYLDSGEPFDKAGSYGIQGYGSLFVKQIEGDYFSVVGLPVSRLARELKAMQAKWSSC